MALEESVEGMEKLESNGIVAWVDTKLKSFLEQLGKITVDYRRGELGSGGYILTTGEDNCSGKCSGC